MSDTVANCVDEAKEYIQNANVVGAIKTSFNQGNIVESQIILIRKNLATDLNPIPVNEILKLC